VHQAIIDSVDPCPQSLRGCEWSAEDASRTIAISSAACVETAIKAGART